MATFWIKFFLFFCYSDSLLSVSYNFSAGALYPSRNLFNFPFLILSVINITWHYHFLNSKTDLSTISLSIPAPNKNIFQTHSLLFHDPYPVACFTSHIFSLTILQQLSAKQNYTFHKNVWWKALKQWWWITSKNWNWLVAIQITHSHTWVYKIKDLQMSK